MADISIIHEGSTDYYVKDAAGRLALAEVENKGAKNIFVTSRGSSTITDCTFTNNGDGTWTTTSSGAVAERRQVGLYFKVPALQNGDYVLSGCPSGGASGTTIYYCLYVWDHTASARVSSNDVGNGIVFSWNPDPKHTYSVTIDVHKGTNPDGLTFKPMICTKAEWDISQAYVPYGKTNAELTSDISALSTENTRQETEIGVVANAGAKNQFNIDASTVVYSCTYTHTNNVLAISGTGGYARVAYQLTLPSGKYVFSANVDSLSASGRVRFNTASAGSGTTIAPDIETSTTGGVSQQINLAAATTFYIMFYSKTTSGEGASAAVYSKIMIRRAEITDGTYAPYAPTNRDLYEEKIGIEDVYGAGTKIGANTNFNDLKTHGLYYSTSTQDIASFTNCPVSAQFTLSVKFGSQSVFQEIQPMSKAEIMYRYVRMFTNGIWSSWYKFEGTEVT